MTPTPEKPKPKSRTKGKSLYPVPAEFLEIFRARKLEKGVLLGRSHIDALAFAARNREAWW